MKLDIRGASYHLESKGKGEPILFLHGFTGSGETWKEAVKGLEEEASIILLDLPGHGKTVLPEMPSRYSMEEACRDLAKILDSLKLEKVNVVGYSMGGRAALSFACLYPNRVNKLVLESASPGLDQMADREARKQQDDKLADFIEAEGMKAFVDKWESIPLFASQRTLPAPLQNEIRKQRLQNKPNELAQSLREMGTGSQPSWWYRLSTLSNETLLLVGEEDKKFCIIAENMEKKLPNAKKIIFSGAGHAIHVEQPKKFGTIIKEFLLKGQI
ncbi:2-succinyl-6-hydroxy-2,4-cyclohexadiene-1-carboxylate synthase [Jeotgalibacillus proteolyticus]|uniref:Putative 2-succinyl-6-hydroxy-2,4-cyclohexadiene-1-carboxylate synthase n=1 Tax=Jeotgalibacillus proteolyticus TaxID=2082395 RepID=A0A2S5GFU5_9BACL|nr:2-succinyl-6-hydroxy-2,4-cyclohexadiene-1-carboxylate synthase [Jeotgalibacillus proteolyticus]PPA71753.1 2-succinyl-6-hydroxy-2,4-cyclohexadiene-1-carboxylate synthase [Jeotgalibacillus proteolyticus]